MNSTAPMPGNGTNGGNGETSIDVLFALSDEQILEIDPEPVDLEISDAHPDASEFDELVASSPSGQDRPGSRQDHLAHRGPVNTQFTGATSEAGRARTQPTQDASTATTVDEAHTSGHEVGASETPPQWLADRMSDPQVGAEARELWNSSQLARQSEPARQEAAAFREVFAKPDDARAAAQRARMLDDIDRAYFAGDATQRAELAASMLREDPAAFREMVFAGLRALEAAGHNPSAPNSTIAAGTLVAQAFRPEGLDANGARPTTTSNSAIQSPLRSGTQPSDRNTLTSEGVSYNSAPRVTNTNSSAIEHSAGQEVTQHGSRVTNHAPADAALAAYSAFERSANDDLERSVGTVIDRTLAQALPATQPLLAVHGESVHARGPALRERLAATIRQDVEKSLQGDRQLGEQVAQILSARRFDNEARASIVRLIGERAQQLVPSAARRVLSEWTQTTLAAHRGQRAREDATTSRRELDPARPAGGSANASRTNTASASRAAATAASSQRSNQASTQRRQDAGATKTTRGVDYRRLSDEQILDS